jgi:hemerythrin-like domain-containing protein
MRELAARVEPDGELYAALRKFSRSIHEHMHLENNVLYPRAIEIENRLRERLSC